MSPRHPKHETNRQKAKIGQPERPVLEAWPFVDAEESGFLAPRSLKENLPGQQSDNTETNLNGNSLEEVWPAGFRLDENTEGQIKRLTDSNTLERSSRSPAPPPKEVRLGSDYEVLALLGQGGMGFVYKVKDKRKNQVVAVKVVRPELAADPRALKRFEQEAEAAMGLLHPNLVPVYAQGLTADGAPFLVMEYQEGKSLDKILRQESFVKADRAVDIFMQICDALEHAHAKGIVHRDLKPSNVVLTKAEGDKDLVRIVDFGIAKVLAGPESREAFNLTHTGDLFGSPSYMSPEQCMGYRLDARSDIYSLGCVMYECLGGQPPFICDNPVQTIVKHLSELPERLNRPQLHGNDIPASLEALVLRCLEKDPRNRCQSMAELRKDLSNIQTDVKPIYAKTRESTGKQLPLIAKIAAIALIDLLCLSIAFAHHEKVVQSVVDANNVIAESDNTSKLFSEAVLNLRAYKASRSPLFAERYQTIVDQMPNEIGRLYSYNPRSHDYQTAVKIIARRTQEGLDNLRADKLSIDKSANNQQSQSEASKAAFKQATADEVNTVLPLDRDLGPITNQLQDKLLEVTLKARRTVAGDPVASSRLWLIGEVLALMLVNMMLVLSLVKNLVAETKRRLWQSKDIERPQAVIKL